MFKNTAGQTITIFAFDAATGLPKTGDAANLSAFISKDGGGVVPLADTSAVEVDADNAPGYYRFSLTQAETDANELLFTAESSTANIVCIARPDQVYTVAADIVIPAPEDPAYTTAYMYTRRNVGVRPGTMVYWWMVKAPPGMGDFFAKETFVTPSDKVTGLWSAPMLKGATYSVSFNQNAVNKVTIPADAGADYALPDYLGVMV